jgi:hypothetical protein
MARHLEEPAAPGHRRQVKHCGVTYRSIRAAQPSQSSLKIVEIALRQAPRHADVFGIRHRDDFLASLQAVNNRLNESIPISGATTEYRCPRI